jgi:hypothetical protein
MFMAYFIREEDNWVYWVMEKSYLKGVMALPKGAPTFADVVDRKLLPH